MSAWSKAQLGWTTPQTASIGVENRVARSEGYASEEAPHHIYKIGDGEFGFPLYEYLLIEFRKTNWLKGGIAIYHVDEQLDNYNKEGYPNQIVNGIKWPSNGNHYKIALLAADGNFDLEKQNNQGNSIDLYSIGQSLLPSEDANGPFPNTDSYQYGNIAPTGVRICVTSDTKGPFMTFLFSDSNPIQPWMTRMSENFENATSSAFSFASAAKVVNNKRCRGSRCVSIKNNTAAMSVTVESTCLTELQVSFDFYSIGLANGEAIILEYSPVGGGADDWILVRSLTKTQKGTGGTNIFHRNRKWFSNSIDWPLTNRKATDMEASYIVLRFRTTSSKTNIFIDNLEIEGKF